jgi:NAD(P)-dependent dehydrogenase (short-subunit alcohol dehydrogenase family)
MGNYISSLITNLSTVWVNMGNHISQLFPKEPPPLTEANIPRQDGRVFLVTGGYSGIGYHISRILYLAGGTVYIAGRNKLKAEKAIESIKANPKDAYHDPSHGIARNQAPSPTASNVANLRCGELKSLVLDLADLSSIRPAARDFLRRERKLDVLFHNAGVSMAPTGSRTQQGHELMMGTNCLGPWLLNHYLTPALGEASKIDSSDGETNRVRVIWTATNVVDMTAPAGGIVMSELDNYANLSPERNYLNSKTGNFFLSSEFHRRTAAEQSVLSLTVNPGGLKTDLLRHKSELYKYCVSCLLYAAVMGAYTVLWAGLSDELFIETDGGVGWVVPWGKKHPNIRQDLLEATREAEEDAEGPEQVRGRAEVFWEWCEDKCRDFM